MNADQLVTPKHPDHSFYGTEGRVRRVIAESPSIKETIIVEIRANGKVFAVLTEASDKWEPV